MIKYVNGKKVEMTPEEVEAQETAIREYWQNADYGELVNQEIRKRYSESQEFAILRQKEDKPEEYAEYYSYCENCKAYIKAQKEAFTEGGE